MLESRATITPGGRIVIPASMRKALDLKIGEEVTLRIESGELHIATLRAAILHAQSVVSKYNKKKMKLSEALIASRKEEQNGEE